MLLGSSDSIPIQLISVRGSSPVGGGEGRPTQRDRVNINSVYRETGVAEGR